MVLNLDFPNGRQASVLIVESSFPVSQSEGNLWKQVKTCNGKASNEDGSISQGL